MKFPITQAHIFANRRARHGLRVLTSGFRKVQALDWPSQRAGRNYPQRMGGGGIGHRRLS
jgi:hypothetical protein